MKLLYQQSRNNIMPATATATVDAECQVFKGPLSDVKRKMNEET